MENSCLGVGKSLTKREKYSESAIFMSVEIDTNLTFKSNPAILLKSIKITHSYQNYLQLTLKGLLPEPDLSYWSRDFIQGSSGCHGQCVPSKPLCRLIVYIMSMWSMLAEESSLRCTNREYTHSDKRLGLLISSVLNGGLIIQQSCCCCIGILQPLNTFY